MVRGAFRVSVNKDSLSFSSAHFITYAGHRCEGLHGHNYRVRATIDGAVDPVDHLVFDFLEIKRIMERLCREIDHVVLLPLKSARIAVSEDGDAVRVSVDGAPRYVFPRGDCALLPIPNTTAEMLAELLAIRLHEALTGAGAKGLTGIELEVEENAGQSAVCRLPME
jgi:6-pyruvoyltetrahydropterin/6-carboxytetrahydropterin synthase